MRWVIFSVVVIVVAAFATVGATYFVPDESPAHHVPSAPEKPHGPTGSAVVAEGNALYDFGLMPQATEGKHEWTILNKGSGPLKLTDGGVTCSCTHGSLPKGGSVTVEPGQTFKMVVNWNTKTFSKYHQTATVIVGNDPDHQKLEFTIEGTVKPPVVTFPAESRIEFLAVSNDAPHPHQIGVASFDRPDTKITSVKANPALFATEVVAMTPEECKQVDVTKGSKVIVSIKPDAPIGPFQEELIVATDHPLKPEIPFTVSGKIEGPINLSPRDRVRIIGVRPKEGASESLTVWVRGQKETKFTVEKKPKDIDVRVDPMGAAGEAMQYRLTVTIPPGLPAGSHFDDTIILKTDHPHASEVKIPVLVIVGAS